MPDTVILDVDGTLVDTVYEHTAAWAQAFADVGLVVPGYVLHAAIGMSADLLVAHVAGDAVERAVGDEVRAHHSAEFTRVAGRLRLLPGADRVVGELQRRGHLVAVATSGSRHDTDRALEEVPDAALLDAVLTGDDLERGKPAPDLLDAALEQVGGRSAVVVGDAPWDAFAATKSGHVVIGVLTGGFTAADLRAAGADLVFDSLEDILDRVEETPLASADRGGRRRPVL